MVSYLPWKLNIFQELFLFMEDIFFSVDLCITDPRSFISTQISARILELVNGFHWIGTARILELFLTKQELFELSVVLVALLFLLQ